jgi:hypothetical protein
MSGEKYEVIDCSSESSEHPVSNISSAKGRWETDGDCTRALVDIRFSQKGGTQIGGVALTNINASFVEILVRNDVDKEFQVRHGSVVTHFATGLIYACCVLLLILLCKTNLTVLLFFFRSHTQGSAPDPYGALLPRLQGGPQAHAHAHLCGDSVPEAVPRQEVADYAALHHAAMGEHRDRARQSSSLQSGVMEMAWMRC